MELIKGKMTRGTEKSPIQVCRSSDLSSTGSLSSYSNSSSPSFDELVCLYQNMKISNEKAQKNSKCSSNIFLRGIEEEFKRESSGNETKTITQTSEDEIDDEDEDENENEKERGNEIIQNQIEKHPEKDSEIRNQKCYVFVKENQHFKFVNEIQKVKIPETKKNELEPQLIDNVSDEPNQKENQNINEEPQNPPSQEHRELIEDEHGNKPENVNEKENEEENKEENNQEENKIETKEETENENETETQNQKEKEEVKEIEQETETKTETETKNQNDNSKENSNLMKEQIQKDLKELVIVNDSNQSQSQNCISCNQNSQPSQTCTDCKENVILKNTEEESIVVLLTEDLSLECEESSKLTENGKRKLSHLKEELKSELTSKEKEDSPTIEQSRYNLFDSLCIYLFCDLTFFQNSI